MQTKEFFDALCLRLSKSNKPKFAVIVDFICDALENKQLKKGDAIPSINLVCKHCDMARETVRKAYNVLREKGLVSSMRGKSFNIASDKVKKANNVFIFLDRLSNAYKEQLIRGINDTVKNKATLTFVAHHLHRPEFETNLENAIGKYERYIIMPVQESACLKLLSDIPQRKLMLLDLFADFPRKKCSQLLQNFDENLIKGLSYLDDKIEKYKGWSFNICFNKEKRHPKEMPAAFLKYCKDRNIEAFVHDSFSPDKLKKNTLWFMLDDEDFVNLIMEARARNFELLKDYAFLTYNDTLIKRVVLNGITTLTIDFYAMGVAVGKQILNWDTHLNKTFDTYLIKGNTF